MKTIFKLNKMPSTNEEIHKAIMEMKSIIDTVIEEKSLEEDHDLTRASYHLDSFLNILEEQFPILLGETEESL